MLQNEREPILKHHGIFLEAYIKAENAGEAQRAKAALAGQWSQMTPEERVGSVDPNTLPDWQEPKFTMKSGDAASLANTIMKLPRDQQKSYLDWAGIPTEGFNPLTQTANPNALLSFLGTKMRITSTNAQAISDQASKNEEEFVNRGVPENDPYRAANTLRMQAAQSVLWGQVESMDIPAAGQSQAPAQSGSPGYEVGTDGKPKLNPVTPKKPMPVTVNENKGIAVVGGKTGLGGAPAMTAKDKEAARVAAEKLKEEQKRTNIMQMNANTSRRNAIVNEHAEKRINEVTGGKKLTPYQVETLIKELRTARQLTVKRRDDILNPVDAETKKKFNKDIGEIDIKIALLEGMSPIPIPRKGKSKPKPKKGKPNKADRYFKQKGV
jgi:hypothetical protein